MTKTQSRTKTRKQRGAGHVEKGTYGKVFRPALPCVGHAGQRPVNHISKVSNLETTALEWNISQKLNQIPGIEQFYEIPDESCDVNIAHLRPDNGFNVSVMKARANGGIPMLQMRDGGNDLFKHLQLTPPDFIPFFTSLTNLFDGLLFLHNNNVAHRDIKPANVVSKKSHDGSFISKFIDPGLNIFLNIDYSGTAAAWEHNKYTIVNEINTQYFYEPVPYMPFDLVLLYTSGGIPRYDDIPYSLNQLGPRAYRAWTVRQLKYFSINPYEKILPTGQAEENPSFKTLVAVLSNSAWRNAMPDKIIQIIKAADIWMLGFTLMAVWTRLTKQMVIHFESKPGTIEDKVYFIPNAFPEIGEGAIGLDDLAQVLIEIQQPDLIPADTIGWYKKVAQDITLPLNKIFMDMMAVAPEDRITIDEALGRYTALLEPIRRHFTKDQVARHFVNLRIIKAPAGAAAAGGGGGGRVATPAVNKPVAQQNNYVAINVAPVGGKKQEGGRRSKKTRRNRV